MKEIARETYDLPIYDSPLRYWGLAADYAPGKQPLREMDETKGDPSESITVVLREGQFQYDNIEAIYRREDGTSDHYNFEVVNPDYNECVFRDGNSRDVPWPVRRALERFGFHEKNTPSSGREFIFDHLLGAVPLLEERVDEDELILRSWLNHFAAGLTTFAFFTSFENQLPYEDYKKVIEAFAEFADDTGWWYSDSQYSHEIFEKVYEGIDVQGPIYFPQKDKHALLSLDEMDDLKRGQESSDTSDGPSTFVTLTFGLDSSSKYVFATHKSRYAFDRYRFAKIGDGEVRLERDDGADFPPYIVIREFQNQGLKIENLPTFGPEDSISEIITTVDAVVQWICKHHKMEHKETIAAFSHYITRLDKALGLAILLEQDRETYYRNHETLLDTVGLSSTDISSKTMNVPGLKTATGPFIKMFDEDTFSVVEETYEDINLRKRRDEYEKLADELESDSPLTDTISRG